MWSRMRRKKRRKRRNIKRSRKWGRRGGFKNIIIFRKDQRKDGKENKRYTV